MKILFLFLCKFLYIVDFLICFETWVLLQTLARRNLSNILFCFSDICWSCVVSHQKFLKRKTWALIEKCFSECFGQKRFDHRSGNTALPEFQSLFTKSRFLAFEVSFRSLQHQAAEVNFWCCSVFSVTKKKERKLYRLRFVIVFSQVTIHWVSAVLSNYGKIYEDTLMIQARCHEPLRAGYEINFPSLKDAGCDTVQFAVGNWLVYFLKLIYTKNCGRQWLCSLIGICPIGDSTNQSSVRI